MVVNPFIINLLKSSENIPESAMEKITFVMLKNKMTKKL